MQRETLYHVEDVGKLLLSVEEELKTLRRQLNEKNDNRDSSASADQLIRKAEAELRAKAKIVLKAVTQNSISTLPTIPSASRSGRSKSQNRSNQRPVVYRQKLRTNTDLEEEMSQNATRDLANIQRPGKSGEIGKLMFREKYGIHISDSPTQKVEKIKHHVVAARRRKVVAPIRRIGPTVRGKPLPPENRTNAKDAPALPITQKDISKGMFSLVNRGILPKAADLTLAFSRGPAPLIAGSMTCHDWQSQFEPRNYKIPHTRRSTFNPHTVKLDVNQSVLSQRRGKKSTQSFLQSKSAQPRVVQIGHELISNHTISNESQLENQNNMTHKTNRGQYETISSDESGEAPNFVDEMDRIRGYNELLDKHSLHQFIIRKGKVLDSTPEFLSFKRTHAVIWGPIITIIRKLETYLGDYAVPIAYIDGRLVVELAKDELNIPNNDDLLMCIENVDEVLPLLQIPGRRYMGSSGQEAAATKLQSKYRQYKQQCSFKNGQLRNSGAEIIINFMRMVLERKRFVKVAAELMSTRQAKWQKLQENFNANWDTIKTHRRVIVHIPSLSLSEFQRTTLPHFALQQNSQLSRILEIADPNVEVVYVAPFELKDKIRQYLDKILQSGEVQTPGLRFKIVVPENSERFSPYMSLSTQLLYSPRTIKRIKHYCKGKRGYIVPRVVSIEEKKLALSLDLPILGSSPEVFELYSSLSGSKSIFNAANVLTAPGAHDIYDEDEILLTLSHLISAEPLTERWLIKLNHETDGRGYAYFTPEILPCIYKIRMEYRQHKDNKEYWSRVSIQERVQNRIFRDLKLNLSKTLKICAPQVYSTYKEFIGWISVHGCVVEGIPGTVIGNPTVNIFVEPSGPVHVLNTHELVCDEKYQPVLSIFPQRSVPHEAIHRIAKSIGKVLRDRKVFGYAQVKLVAFQLQEEKLRMWAVGLELGYSRTHASFATFNFLMKGQFDSLGGRYLVPSTQGNNTKYPDNISNEDDKDNREENEIISKERRSNNKQWEPRTYASVDILYHQCLTSVRFDTFFDQCRVHGVSYDLKDRSGCIFSLYDSLASGVLGIHTVAPRRRLALDIMRNAFIFIRRQIGGGRPKTEFEDESSNFERSQRQVRLILKEYKDTEDNKNSTS